jgi:hypothetical protein
MTDNWQLEDKINEVVSNHNQLLIAVHTLLDAIDQNQRMRVQKAIDTIAARIKISGVTFIELLDLSPRDAEAYQPRLIMTERKTIQSRAVEELPSAGPEELE